ncbi:hypothetical protein LCGC14_3029690 [marine sediment metagenome]|uniref:Uncharacterized protein n=1 Tax=marine sediment metagenome TaxID=412755 RepID=A0A0F8XG23_9ZZZZ
MTLPRAYSLVGAGAGDLLANGTVPLTANWDLGGFDLKNVGNIGVGIVAPLSRLHTRGASALRFDNGATDGFIVSQINTNTWSWTGLSAGSFMVLQNASLIIGTSIPRGGLLHLDQGISNAAVPVMLLVQADQSEEFVRLVGYSHASDASLSLVDASALTTPGAIVGWKKEYIQDDANNITDGVYYVPFHTAPTA